jgi:hypothetical protein
LTTTYGEGTLMLRYTTCIEGVYEHAQLYAYTSRPRHSHSMHKHIGQ